MKTVLSVVGATLMLSGAAFAGSHAEGEIDEATIEQIMAMLTDMKCQMDPDDIEVEDDGYELDDVICEGGQQMDIELDAELNEVGRRLE